MHHAGDYTPYEGKEVTGYPIATYLRGRAIFKDGELIGPSSGGEHLGARALPDDRTHGPLHHAVQSDHRRCEFRPGQLDEVEGDSLVTRKSGAVLRHGALKRLHAH